MPVAQQQDPHEHGVGGETAREAGLRRLEGRTLGRAVAALEEGAQRCVAGRLLESVGLVGLGIGLGLEVRVRARVRVRVRAGIRVRVRKLCSPSLPRSCAEVMVSMSPVSGPVAWMWYEASQPCSAGKMRWQKEMSCITKTW